MSERLAIAFFVPGTPVAQPRPRARAYLVKDENGAYMRDRFGRPVPRAQIYDPGTADCWQGAVRGAARPYGPPAPFEGPMHVRLEVRLPRPKCHYREGRFFDRLREDAPQWPVQRPDIDNLVKAILDGLTGIMWQDDGQVCQLEVVKFFSSSPGVVVELEPLGMSGEDQLELEMGLEESDECEVMNDE